MARSRKRAAFRPKLISFAVASCFTAGTALANPTGPTVVSGQASIHQAGNLLQITNTPNAILNWQSFSIGAGEITRFIQQSAASAVLNRVTGSGGAINPSVILGSLQSNGRVFLVNPSGVLFGAGSQVDVAGLVATSLNLSNADFLAGRMLFGESAGAGSVRNAGNINTASGGEVYLVGSSVTNSGIITSPNGEVVLAAGKSVELVNPGTPNLRVQVAASNHEARNLGRIIADSGRIGIYAGLISQSGTIRADSAVAEGGRIVLKATKNTTLAAGSTTTANGTSGGSVTIQSGDTTLVSGIVEATSLKSPPSQGGESATADGVVDGAVGVVGKGGTIQILGNLVGIIDSASLDASGEAGGGTVLVGGDFQGKNPEVQNAFRTYVGSDSIITADAVGSGDGGTVIVWADDVTRAYGAINARGGAQSGNGGFVEVSGGGVLEFAASVNTSAPNGAFGTLLLDPKFIDINDTGGVPLKGNFLFAENPTGTSVILATGAGSISAQTTDVVLQANTDVTFTSPVSIANLGTKLTAQAGRSILVKANITTNDGNITLSANDEAAQLANRDLGPGGITMDAGTTINAGAAGVVTLRVGTGPVGAAPTESGNITVENITAANVNLQQLGRTNGSSILRASPNSMITAANLLMEIDSLGTASGGSIGTAAAPMRVTVTNLESHTHEASPGIFIDSPTQGLTIGGVPFFGGSVRGVQNVTSGDVSITVNGDLTQLIGGAGCGLTGGAGGPVCTTSGDVTLQAAGNMFVNAPVMASGNIVSVTLIAGTGITVSDTIVSASGSSFQNTAAKVSMSTTQPGSTITIANDSLVIAGAGEGHAAINVSAPGGITVSSSSAVGAFASSNATVAMTASAGSITLDGSVLVGVQSSSFVGSVTLDAGGLIQGAGTVAATSIDARAVNGISFVADASKLSALNTTSGDIDIQVVGAGTLTLVTSPFVGNALHNSGGSVFLSSSRAIDVQSNVVASSDISLTANGTGADSSITVGSGLLVSTVGGNLFMRADNMALAAATKVAGNNIALGRWTQGNIGLGAGVAGDLILTQADLDVLATDTANGNLTLGFNDGIIAFNAPVSFSSSKVQTLVLRPGDVFGGDGVTQKTLGLDGVDAPLTVTKLAIDGGEGSGNTFGVSMNAQNLVGTLAIGSTAGIGTKPNQVSFTNAKDLEIGTVAGIDGITADPDGACCGGADVTIAVTNGNLVVNRSILAFAGNSDDARITLAASGNISIASPVSLPQTEVKAVAGDVGEGVGDAIISFTSGGSITVDNSLVQALGGQGASFSRGGRADIFFIAPAGITIQNGSTVEALGGNGDGIIPSGTSSSQGLIDLCAADFDGGCLSFAAGASKITVSDSLVRAKGGDGAEGSIGSLRLVAGTGGIGVTGSTLEAIAGKGLSSSNLSKGGAATVSFEAQNTITLDSTTVNVTGGNGGESGGDATLLINAVAGNVTITGGAITVVAGNAGNREGGNFVDTNGGFAEVTVEAAGSITVGGDMTVTGGKGGSANASGGSFFASAEARGGGASVSLEAVNGSATVSGNITVAGGPGGNAVATGFSGLGPDASGGSASVSIVAATGITVGGNMTATGGAAGTASAGSFALMVGGDASVFMSTAGPITVAGQVTAAAGAGSSGGFASVRLLFDSCMDNCIEPAGDVNITGGLHAIGGDGFVAGFAEVEVLASKIIVNGGTIAAVGGTGTVGGFATTTLTSQGAITLTNATVEAYAGAGAIADVILDAGGNVSITGGEVAAETGGGSGQAFVEVFSTGGAITLSGANVLSSGENLAVTGFTAAGTISAANNSTISATSASFGIIFMTTSLADSDILLGTSALTATTNITLASASAISQVNGGTLTAPFATLQAASGIGTVADPIETSVSQIALISSGGEIGVFNTGNLTLNSLSLSGSGAARVVATGAMSSGGEIGVFNTGNLTLNSLSLSGSGAARVVATGAMTTAGFVNVGGDLTLLANGIHVNRSVFSGGSTLALNAGAGDLNVIADGGEDVVVNGSNVFLLGANVNVLGGALSFTSAAVNASSFLSVATPGNFTVQGGSGSNTPASVFGGGSGGVGISTFGNVVVAGGSGANSPASITGNPDVFILIFGGGTVQVNPHATSGSTATVNSGSPATITLEFPKLTSGGYSVDGVPGAITDGLVTSGFFAEGQPAVLDQSLIVVYGAPLPDITPPPPAEVVSQPPPEAPPMDTTAEGSGSSGKPEDEKKKGLPVCSR